MGCHQDSKKSNKNDLKEYLLIGNPNVGKSTVFNHITKAASQIGNFNRTTVAAKRGLVKGKQKIALIDLPGVYNLNSENEDEMVAINSLMNKEYSGIVNVINANTFKRDINLTIQLLETNKEICLNLNMIDELNQMKISEVKLQSLLKCTTNLTIAKKNIGVNNIPRLLNCPIKGFKLNYGPEVEDKINKIIELITIDCFSKRFIAIQLLQNNENARKHLIDNGQDIEHIDNILLEDVSLQINKIRNEFIDKLFLSVYIHDETVIYNEKTLVNNIDNLILKSWFGIPLFFIVLMCVYYITFGPYTGGWLQGEIDTLLNDDLLELISNKMIQINSPWWLESFICHGLLSGFFSVIPFFVYIIILFAFIGLFQQSGYMARVSVVMDRAMYNFGLSGRSVIALISGIGCNVPTILMARATKSKREKLTSIFIAPFISCSARATVFAYVTSLFFINYSWIIIFFIQITSGVLALIIGLVFSNVMFRKRPYMIASEIPKWRTPDMKSVFKLIKLECKTFFKKVLKFVVVGAIVLWFLIHLGTRGLLNDDQLNESFIFYIAKYISYIFIPTGLNDPRLVASLLLAFPAKELAISNMIIVFNSNANIQNYFNVRIAVSYIIFFLLYIPCISTMATIKAESNKKIMFINIGVSLIVAWTLSTIIYQILFFI